jgi:CelD/BcsL family acetyltransferase involved in cellulose biosynthesis
VNKTTVEVKDRIEPLVAEWERLAQDTNADPFIWPGWISAWWRAFGKGQLHIITAYEDGSLVGVLPLRQSHGRLSSTTNYHTPWFGFLAANERAARQLSRALFSKKPRRVDLSYLSPTDIGISPACAAASAACYRVLTRSTHAAPYVDTNQSWEAYESRLRKQFRSDLHRRRRRLEEAGQVTLEVADGTQRLSELLEEGFRIESSGWKEARGTNINAHPVTRHFYTEVARWAAEHGWLRLAFLRLDGRALAFDYCLEHNGIHYMLKTGYDPAYRQFSPGRIIRYLMLARAFSSPISTYDLLGPDYEWKREWSSAQQEILLLHMFAPTALGFIDRAALVHGRPAAKRALSLASSIFGERGNHWLDRGRAVVRTGRERFS